MFASVNVSNGIIDENVYPLKSFAQEKINQNHSGRTRVSASSINNTCGILSGLTQTLYVGRFLYLEKNQFDAAGIYQFVKHLSTFNSFLVGSLMSCMLSAHQPIH